MQKLQKLLTEQRSRADTLASRHAAAEAAYLQAKVRLQHHLLEADLDADERAGEKLEAAVAACAQKRDALADALGEVRRMIGDTEGKITAEQQAIERAQASEQLARDLDVIQGRAAAWLAASREFLASLDTVHWHFEISAMRQYIERCAGEVEIAAAFATEELRSMVGTIREGRQPIPSAKPEVIEPKVIEPPPPTETVFMLKSVKFSHDSRTRYAAQFEDFEMPLQYAQRALRCGAAVPMTDPRRRELHGARGGQHANPNALDIVDLDDEEATRSPHIAPILASDPVLREGELSDA